MLNKLTSEPVEVLFSSYVFPILSIVAAIVVGVFVARQTIVWQEKRRLAYDMHREINSADMMTYRTKVQMVLGRHHEENLDKLLDKVPSKIQAVWPITGFYERLYFAMKHNNIAVKLCPELFAPLFLFFMEAYFRRQLKPCDWDLWPTMEALEAMLRKHSSLKEWNDWSDFAKRNAEEALRKYRL